MNDAECCCCCRLLQSQGASPELSEGSPQLLLCLNSRPVFVSCRAFPSLALPDDAVAHSGALTLEFAYVRG